MTSVSSNERKHTGENPLRRWILGQFFDTARELLPADVKTIADAGCGEGYGAKEFFEYRPELQIYGFDLSMVSLQRVPEVSTDLRPFAASVYEPPLPTNSVDLVISMEVLEHLDEPARAIEAYKRISRRYLLLSVPNEPKFRLMRMAAGYDIAQFGDHPEHVNHWNLRTFKNFLQDNGLTIVKSVSPVPFIWSVVLCEIA